MNFFWTAGRLAHKMKKSKKVGWRRVALVGRGPAKCLQVKKTFLFVGF